MADHIQIGDIAPRIHYTGDGATLAFTYPFPIFQDADIAVYVDGDKQTLTTHYAVTGAGQSAGGSVTFLLAPGNGAAVALVRELTIKRLSDFQSSGEFRAKVINDELDFQTAVLQQLEDDIVRSVRLSASDPTASLTLPDKASRADRLLAFDANGAMTTVLPNTDTYIAVTPFGETLLDDADAAEARATLGAEAADAEILKADTSDTLIVGMLGASHDLGDLSSATTLGIADGNIQHGTMTGSFTLTAPDDADDGYIDLELTIDATGGYVLTLVGFNEVEGAVDTTANIVNVLRISKLNTNTYLQVMQGV